MEIIYHLHNRGESRSIAQGHIKDYPTAEEAIERLLERIGTALASELLNVTGQLAPWEIVVNVTLADPAGGPPRLVGYGGREDTRLDGVGRELNAH